MESSEQDTVVERIPLKRTGKPEDIAQAVVYFVDEAHYVTGQVLFVDGGRSLFS
jgi:pteridine reductase